MATAFVAHFYPEQDFSKAVHKGRKLEVIGTTFRTRGAAVKALFQKLQQSPRDVRHLSPYVIELEMPSRKVLGYEVIEFRHEGYGNRRRNGEVSPGVYALDIPGVRGPVSGREIVTPHYYARFFDAPGQGFLPSMQPPVFREVQEPGPVVRDYPQAPTPSRALPPAPAPQKTQPSKASKPSREERKAQNKAKAAALRAEKATPSPTPKASKPSREERKAQNKAKAAALRAEKAASAESKSSAPKAGTSRLAGVVPPRSSRAQSSQQRMDVIEAVLQPYWDKVRTEYEASGKTGRVPGLPGDQMPIPTWYYPESVLRDMTKYGIFALATALGVPHRHKDIPKYGENPNNTSQSREGVKDRGLIPEIIAVQRKAGIEALARKGAIPTATVETAKTEIAMFDAIGRTKDVPKPSPKFPVSPKGSTSKKAAPLAPKSAKAPKAAEPKGTKQQELSPEEQARREQDKLESPPKGKDQPLRAKINSRGDRILLNYDRAGELKAIYLIRQANSDYKDGAAPNPAFVKALNDVDAGKRSVEDIKAMLKAGQHILPGTRRPSTPPTITSPKIRGSGAGSKARKRNVFPVAFGVDAVGNEDRTQIVARDVSGRMMPEELAALTSKLERIVANSPGHVIRRDVIDIFNDPDTSYEDLAALLKAKKGDTSAILERARTGRTTPTVTTPARTSTRKTTQATGAPSGSTRKSSRPAQQPLPFEDAGKAADEFWEGNLGNLLDL